MIKFFGFYIYYLYNTAFYSSWMTHLLISQLRKTLTTQPTPDSTSYLAAEKTVAPHIFDLQLWELVDRIAQKIL